MGRTREDGFACLALLILVAVLGVAAAATLQAGAIAQRRAAEEELLVVGRAYRDAFRTYYERTPAGHKRYPAKLTDLLKDPRYPGVVRHLRQLFPDPLTGSPEWGVIEAPAGGIMGVYSRSDGTPIKIALFPREFQSFQGQKSYAGWAFFYSPDAPTKRAAEDSLLAPRAPSDASSPPDARRDPSNRNAPRS